MATKQKLLFLEQKVEAIKLLDTRKSAYKIAEEFGVGKTQIKFKEKKKQKY